MTAPTPSSRAAGWLVLAVLLSQGIAAPARASEAPGTRENVDPCRLATPETVAKAVFRERTVPDEDFYRDDAMALVREEIDETRRLAKGWEETERVFLQECKEIEAREQFLREIGTAIQELSRSDTCEGWREKFLELHATCQVARETILIPPEMWTLFSRFEDIKNPDWCTSGGGTTGNAGGAASSYAKVRAGFEDMQVMLERRLAAMQEGHELQLLRREYEAKAAKVFALDHLLQHQRLLREAQAKDASRALSSQTVGKLPWIIVILGVFCLSIMVMVRRYPETVQREWVQSGQVIQFMTVTIIIIVIFALGLSGNLNQESLGTLLGTVGGYVLSNGVGKGRAGPAQPSGDREVERDRKQTDGKPEEPAK